MDLCTKADVKAYFGGDMEGVTKYDAIIDLIIPGITAMFEKHCGRSFEKGQITEYFSSDGHRRTLQLNKYPVDSAVTITLYDDPNRVYSTTTLIAATDYSIDYEVGIIRLDPTAYFTRGVRNIKVVYTGGYALAAIPADLKLAAIIQAMAMIRRRPTQGKVSKSSRANSVNTDMDPIVSEAKKFLEGFMLWAQEY